MTRLGLHKLGLFSLVGLGPMLLTAGCLTSSSIHNQSPPLTKVVAQRLPGPGTRVIVWDIVMPLRASSESNAAQALIFELLHRGLTVIERSQIERVLNMQKFSLLHGSDEAILRAGHLLNAEQIVFVREEDDHVHLRGVDAETGRIMWSGTGWVTYPSYYWDGHTRHGRWKDEGAKLTRAIIDELWKPTGQTAELQAESPRLSLHVSPN
ncbi:MAG: hypothetical protein ACT4OO_07595 [Nitrospiraceae bacterium]